MATEGQQKQPERKAPWPQATGVWATYDLHCYCGAVRFDMKISPPLYKEQIESGEQYPVTECHCSHCERVGALMVHPLFDNVQFTQGKEVMAKHYSASGKNPHYHCSKCGCFLVTDLTHVMTEVFKMENRWCVNLRMLKDCDLSKLAITQSYQMKDMGPKYAMLS